MAKIFAFIFARGGSKGVPRKNIRLLAGKPLLAHAIAAAQATARVARIIVSTEDEEIAQIARQWGADVPFLRPPELATDTAPEWLAWQHAIKGAREHYGDFDVFLVVPATAPLRVPQDLENCVTTLLSGNCDVAFSIRESQRNPYYNMVSMDEAGLVKIMIQTVSPLVRRQDAPQAYDITTVGYAMRPEFVLAAQSVWDGNCKGVLVPEERALDIDTPFDFALAEFLMSRKGIDHSAAELGS